MREGCVLAHIGLTVESAYQRTAHNHNKWEKDIMRQIVGIALTCMVLALCGCSSGTAPEQPQKLPSFTLSPSEKAALDAYCKNILSVESLADKAVKLAKNEAMNVIKGGEGSITLASLTDKAKNESLRAVESLAKTNIPEALPAEVKNLLKDGKSDLISAYTAHAESFEAIKSFIADKSPMALIEYRNKSSQAQELLSRATSRLDQIMRASEASQQK